MATISVSLPADGTTADVSDYNTPITTITNAINGGLDNSNIAATAAIDPAKFAGGSATMLGVWIAWTPVVTAATGAFTTVTATGKYTQIGKTVHWRTDITITNIGTAAGAVIFTLPVTSAIGTGNVGSGREDNASGKMISAKLNSTTTVASSNFDNTSWISGTSIGRLSGTYEAV